MATTTAPKQRSDTAEQILDLAEFGLAGLDFLLEGAAFFQEGFEDLVFGDVGDFFALDAGTAGTWSNRGEVDEVQRRQFC